MCELGVGCGKAIIYLHIILSVSVSVFLMTFTFELGGFGLHLIVIYTLFPGSVAAHCLVDLIWNIGALGSSDSQLRWQILNLLCFITM